MTTTMKRHKWSRRAGFGLCAALLLALSGDGIGAGVSPRGVDPLDVLDLQVKPNVIIVLDSSGSMQETLFQRHLPGADNILNTADDTFPPSNWTADWRYAKTSTAKSVLIPLVQNNAAKASFLFGQYTESGALMQNTGVGVTTSGDLTGTSRFFYETAADWQDANDNGVMDVGDTLVGTGGMAPTMLTACAAPWTTPCELTMSAEPGAPASSSVTIGATNNRLEWTERINATTATTLTYAYCSANLTNGTYTGDAGMTALAADITAKMVTAACVRYTCTVGCTATGTPGNTFTATWAPATAKLTLTLGGSARYYQMRFAAPNSAAATLGWGAANLPAFTTPGPTNTNITAATMAVGQWLNAATVITGAALGSPATGAAASRGYQAWQSITSSWNTLYFSENGVTNCAVTITPKFYARGQDLAAEMALKMNACARPAPANVYTVTYAIATGKFTFATTANNKSFIVQWTKTPNNIAGALSAYSGTTGTPPQATYTDKSVAAASGTTGFVTLNNSIVLLARTTGNKQEDANFDPDGVAGPLGPQDRTAFAWNAGAYFNGELFYVHGDGSLCSVDLSSPVKTNPPTIRMQQVSDCTNLATTVGGVVTAEFAGGSYGTNPISCNGFQADVALVACDKPSNTASIVAFLDKEFPIDGVAANPTFGQIKSYQEMQDGTRAIQSLPAVGGIHANGSTPIANSLITIKTLFGTTSATGLWGSGQADNAATVTIDESRGPIRKQQSPRERTIVMFVTDGDDTCNGDGGTATGPSGDEKALRAAHKAQLLYTLIPEPLGAPALPESSVTTYMIGLGTGASTNRLNWIAWGGSGMGQGLPGQPAVATTQAGNAPASDLRWNDTAANLQTKRATCTTCVDAYFAPDADTLAAQLQSILDQGAGSGEFTAQQAVFTPVMELVKESGFGDPEAPNTRYDGVVPELFRSTFQLPGFKGQLKAFQNDSGQVALKWNAGTKLFNRVSGSLATCSEGGGGSLGECKFSSLLTRIDRRIYTTSGNGVFGTTIGNLTSAAWLKAGGNRAVLWPASAAVAPTTDATVGLLDAALGLPLTNDDLTFTQLQATYQACLGATLPASCSAAQPLKTQRARREAREMILAYMAGGKISITALSVPKRMTTNGELLYATRDWMLADSTLATPAVIGQPIQPDLPNTHPFKAEYALFRDGFRDAFNKATGDGTDIGFGLRNPDKDADHTTSAADTALPNLKPAMTVIYAAANDMLHAFRAGPNCSTAAPYEAPPGTTTPPFSGWRYSACAELGGEELWGFVPFDQIGKLRQRMTTQTRANHVYMLAAGLRFGDVFVPNPGTNVNPSGSTVAISVGSASQNVQGVWRRVLIFGRGIAGKYLTVLDVTTPGDYKTLAKNTIPPVVYWSRGNPDTTDGSAGGTANGSAADKLAYAQMGETWSVPTLAFVDRATNTTPRKPNGADFVLYSGSGYGDTSGCPSSSPCEGQTFYTLDALTGDVVASAKVPAAVGTPTGLYPNSLVANATAFNPEEFVAAAAGTSAHPAASKTERVYIGDLHGRLWKFLASAPGTPLLVTNLGINQPIAAPVALLGFDQGGVTVPHVYVTTGYDNREPLPSPASATLPAVVGEAFKIAAIKDDLTTALSPSDACLQSPVVAPCLFARDLVQDFGGVTGYFRGTLQPATLFTSTKPPLGRVFYGGTRFNPPNSKFTPPTCTGPTCVVQVPCRSSFDSVIYALGAKTGLAAFDLNDGGLDDSYVVFDNSKIAGLGIFATTDSSGAAAEAFYVDEGLNTDPGTAEGAKPRAATLPGKGKAPTVGGNGSVKTLELRSSSTVCQ